jgi:hypothetical protein
MSTGIDEQIRDHTSGAVPRRQPAAAAVGPGQLARGLQFGARSVARRVIGPLVARSLLRMAIGRWPSSAEVAAFRAGFTRDVMLPPLLRALANVPAAREPLTRAMLATWLLADPNYRGRLREGLDSDIVATTGDALQIWSGPRIGFIHIQKTAGSSITQMLERLFHPTQIAPERAVREALALPPSDRWPHSAPVRRFALIAGHYDYPGLRSLGPDRFLLTFLRDPVKRVLSLYYFWRSYDLRRVAPSETHKGIECACERPLLEFLRAREPMVQTMIDNAYVRRLTGLGYFDPAADALAEDPEGALRRALQALDDFGFVGLTERMDESLAVLGSLLEFTPPASSPQVNVSSANETGPWSRFRAVAREPVTKAIEQELARLTRLDRVVYEAAMRRLDRDLRAAEG